MKKIILINSPVYDSDDRRNFLPLGICYLAAALRNNKYCCDICDGNLDYPTIDEIVDIAVQYDLVGISSNTINFPNAIKIAEAIKNIKDVPILLGGHHATFEHIFIVNQYDCFDAIVRGEGEKAIVQLCDDIFSNGSFSHEINGVTYKNFKGKVCLSDTIILEDDIETSALPIRDTQGKYPRKPLPYENDKLYVSIATSRGCPYGCSFCSVTSFRSKWVARSAESVAEEAYSLYKTYSDIFIVFADDNFYINPERSKEIVSNINAKCGENIGFSFATSADQIIRNGSDYLRYFKENGCYSIELGVENGSNNMLKRFCKNTTADQNNLAIKMIREQGIYVAVDYILFDPETSVEELKENIVFMKSANIFGHYPPLLFNRIKPYPGTKFTEQFGYISDEDYFKNKNVNDIYECIQKFKEELHRRINRIMDIIELNIQAGNADRSQKGDYIWLKMLPYNVFEKLVNCTSNYYEYYDSLISDLKIEDRISFFENKYGR